MLDWLILGGIAWLIYQEESKNNTKPSEKVPHARSKPQPTRTESRPYNSSHNSSYRSSEPTYRDTSWDRVNDNGFNDIADRDFDGWY